MHEIRLPSQRLGNDHWPDSFKLCNNKSIQSLILIKRSPQNEMQKEGLVTI